MEHATRPVTAGLRGYVAGVIGYAYAGAPPENHRGLPSQHLALVVSLDEPLGVAFPGEPVEKFHVLVGGLHDTAVAVGQSANRSGVQVSLTPEGSRVLFGVPPGELSGVTLDLGDVLGADARRLPDRMAMATTWPERFDVIEEYLARVARDRTTEPRPEVDWAWRRLRDTGGRVGVQQLATEVGWSRRHLTDRFQREYGLAPKVAARVLRFERSVGEVRSSVRPQLAEIATRCGYADQAHLTREWQAIAGCSPGTWIAEELPYVQDVSELPGYSDAHD